MPPRSGAVTCKPSLVALAILPTREKVARQLDVKKNGRSLEVATRLIDTEISNSIETLKTSLPSSRFVRDVIGKLRLVRQELYSKSQKSIASLLGREGQAAIAYFSPRPFIRQIS